MPLVISKTTPGCATLTDHMGRRLSLSQWGDWLAMAAHVPISLDKADMAALRDLLTVVIETGKLPKEAEVAKCPR